MTTAAELDQHFLEVVGALPGGPPRPDPAAPVRDGSRLAGGTLLAIFDAQAQSRQLDFAARWMQQQGRGFYTISSAGHEGNAAVAAALRPGDPALLHYRSGGFYCARAQQVDGVDPIQDVLLGVAASADEPIAGGRHKVFGRAELSIIPQTSTIASHLPRALGVALGIGRAAKLGVPCPWPRDAVTVASFGDASASHSTAVGAINAACHTSFQGIPVPLLLVCEDNGIGISVPTPRGWVAAAFDGRPGLRYLAADGCDPVAAYDAAAEAAALARSRRCPVFLHLSMVRFLGHAGSDAEAAYRPLADLAADLDRDPLVATAAALVRCGLLTPGEAVARYVAIGGWVRGAAEQALASRPLTSATEVMAPLAPRRPDLVAQRARRGPPVTSAGTEPVTLAQAINLALAELLEAYPGMCVFGEDVARKGGVYGVTKGLMRRFGAARVFDTLLDEQSILGLALGGGLAGLLPVPEIQYLAYLHNAEDQVRGEAATEQFFSAGQFRNPMVLRVAGYGYQKGFGGHFHNDNAVGVLRDIPGLVIASPSRPDDAAAMLRTCLAAAAVDGSVCVFLEPIALYHTRDLHDEGDGGWLAPYPRPDAHVPVGQARSYGDGTDLTLVTFGNGLRMSLRVASRLAGRGISSRVVDLRWLAPMPVGHLLYEAEVTGRVLVVDETRRSGGVSEGVVTALVDAGYRGRIARVTSEDSFIPLGRAASAVLLDEPTIEKAAVDLVHGA
ncbi:MAG TPA: thiamine pyrophosphate-dependent enzyme [Streptosporangiaceae bacterium]|nr:thiamine pyrophosphate-dependent enzyme [Streptosporangiaceae bacterium]